jgi:hypothetical protein
MPVDSPLDEWSPPLAYQGQVCQGLAPRMAESRGSLPVEGDGSFLAEQMVEYHLVDLDRQVDKVHRHLYGLLCGYEGRGKEKLRRAHVEGNNRELILGDIIMDPIAEHQD